METIGLAKSAPTILEQVVPVPIPDAANIPVMIDGVPLELMDYFDIDMQRADSRSRRQIKDIYDMTKGDNIGMGNIMQILRDIEIKLGYPSGGETRYGRIWGWLRVNDKISDLLKQRDAIKG